MRYDMAAFTATVIPTIPVDGMTADEAKAAILSHVKEKMISVVDEEGNEIDLEATLVVHTAAAKMDEEEHPDDDDEMKLAKRVDELVTKRLGELAEKSKPPVRIATKATTAGSDKPKIEIPRRFGRLKNFTTDRGGVSADERAYRFGSWALACIGKSIGREFPKSERFVSDVMGIKLSNTYSNQDGGYLVPEEFGTDIVDLREVYGVARRILRVLPMSSDTRSDPRRVGGLTANFVGEGQAGTESTKAWDNVRLTAKKIMCLSRMTNELNEDAVINIGDDLAGEIAYAFSEKEDQCAFNGDGTSTFGGIIGIRTKLQDVDGAGTDSAGLIDAAGTTWSAITMANFSSVIGALPQYADTPNAVWVCHRTFFYSVMDQLVTAQGGVTATETRQGNRAPRPLFRGYPVEFSQVYPSATATSSVVCTFGDHSLGARLGDRRSETIAFSDSADIGGENVFERDEIAIRGTERFDVNAHDVGDASNAGPICGLQTTAS